jgi:hypothetical protein
MMLAVALTVAVAPVPIPLPVPTLKPLDALVSKAFSHFAWQRVLAPDDRSGLNDCLLTDYDLGWKVVLPLEARGSKKVES